MKSVISSVYQMGALYERGSSVGWKKSDNRKPRTKKAYRKQQRRAAAINLQSLAKNLLNNPTDSERLLSESMRAAGWKFRQSHILHGYIADFFFPKHNLVVELDGRWHKGREQHDADRDKHLAKRGIKTLRFQSATVFNGGHKVIMSTIAAEIKRQSANRIRPAESPVTAVGHCVGSITGASRDAQDQSPPQDRER